MKNPAFTYEQWIEIIPSIETLPEFAAFEEMLRSDCRMMLGEWGIDKVTTLTGLMRELHQRLIAPPK